MALRHFPYRHPTFGTAARPKTSSHWKTSVYYWWYEYLRRNADYRLTCQSGGGTCGDLFQHFGDVTKGDFKSWWTEKDRGARLFAEPPTPTIKLIPPDAVQQGGFQRENTVVLQVPLSLPMVRLVDKFRELVSEHQNGKRGKRQSEKTETLFQVTGKVDNGFLQIALAVWDARQASPKTPLWQIAQDLGIGGAHRIKAGDSAAEITDKKNFLASTVSRYYRKADAAIKRVGEGRFPN